MHHLNVLGRMACEADDPYVPSGRKLYGWEDLDEVDCPDCKATLFWEAAERLAMQKAYYADDLIGRLLAASGHVRTNGQLGDRSVVEEGMTPGERLSAVHATMTLEEKNEALARVHDAVKDTCASCGGSIAHDEHSEDCLGPDPDKWIEQLSAEQINAELRVQGTDPQPALAQMKARIDGLMAEYGQKAE